LADHLGLTRAQISAWRNGKSELGTLTRLKLLDALGHDTLRTAILSLLPEKNGDDAIKLQNNLVARVGYGMSLQNNVTERKVLDSDSAFNSNQLLAALTADERERIEPHLSPVSMAIGRVVYEPGDELGYVYLPTTAIISMLYVMENGESAEIAIVGREGLLGIALFMGGDTMPNRAIVQNAGQAYRISQQVVKEEFARGGMLQQVFLRYTQALITQMMQTAACNRHHTIAQQFCRWLLLSLDRMDVNRLSMTQDLIANMLGVRKASVTEVAKQLQESGMIRYYRGRIDVLDRPALEASVCECYYAVQRECSRLYSGLVPPLHEK